MVNPILIAAPKRCGTTMLAWLLHLHGVWIGPGRVTADPSTNPQVPTENTAIKEYLQSINGVPDDFADRIAALAQTERPWLVKAVQNLLRQDAWLTHFSDAVWLLPYRSVADCAASKGRQLGRSNREADRRTIRHQFRLQARVADKAKHSLYVSADALCSGDASEAEKAVKFCGLPVYPNVYRNWVQPERWHG